METTIGSDSVIRQSVLPLLVATSNAFVSGCAGAPVGWGGAYEVLLKNEKSITIEYDELVSSYKAIGAIAQIHCEQFGKVAIPAGETTTRTNGMIKTHTFKCE